MNDKFKNLLIGLFISGAIAVIVIVILFLDPKIGDGKKTLYVRFSNIAGIGVGTRVTFSGMPVGEVKTIHEVANAREEPTDELGRVYFYQLTLKIDSSVEVYNTDEIIISTTGLLGEKSIAIIPKAPPKNTIPKLITNQIIYADSVDPLENALHEITNLSKSLESAVKDIDQWFNENSEDLSVAVESFAGAMREINVTVQTVNQKEVVGSVKIALDGFSENMTLIQSSLEKMQDEQTIAKFTNVLENINDAVSTFNIDGKSILSNINVITNDIADGSGTIGKLVKNDDLYLKISSITTKANTLMNDLNHYGLLFQYDKKWQRSRMKRANLLQNLSTPKQFREFFETEMDDIQTALSRISMMLDKAQDSQEKAKIMKSELFLSDFKLLLQQVDDLSGVLKTYNENLVDQLDCPSN